MILEKADVDLICMALYEYAEKQKSETITKFADSIVDEVEKLCDSPYDQIADEMPIVQITRA